MELLKVNFYNKGFKLDIEKDFFEISVENAKNATKQLNIDEIFDAINSANSDVSGYIYSEKEIKEKVIDEYPEQFENLLHEFFNKKSDSNKYLTTEQQEEMENEFYDFINQYNKCREFKT